MHLTESRICRYLEKDDDEEDGKTDEMAYQPAPGSPSTEDVQPKPTAADDDEDDPLDAFMADINQQAKKDKEASERHEVDKEKATVAEKDDKKKLGRTDIDEEDMQESYFRSVVAACIIVLYNKMCVQKFIL
jgi:ATP-dependent RNA helicase DDX42